MTSTDGFLGSHVFNPRSMSSCFFMSRVNRKVVMIVTDMVLNFIFNKATMTAVSGL